MNSKQLGDWGEKIAQNYLQRKGYQILDRNYVSKFISGPQRGEIDIVAKKKGIISFIEVKTLILKPTSANQKNPRSWIFLIGGFEPETKVNSPKQRKLIKTAQHWLMEKKLPLDSKWQIDVLSIRIDSESKKAKIRHFENVFSV